MSNARLERAEVHLGGRGLIDALPIHIRNDAHHRFWAILQETGLTDRLLDPSEFASLPDFGIGLIDLEEAKSGDDACIDFGRFGSQSFRERILVLL